jgi:hypothetical protein
VSLNCVEAVVFETYRIDGVPHAYVVQLLAYGHTSAFHPPLFGMLATSRQVSDSSGVRYFNNSVSGSSIVTQEDQCVDEEVEHYAGEVINFSSP